MLRSTAQVLDPLFWQTRLARGPHASRLRRPVIASPALRQYSLNPGAWFSSAHLAGLSAATSCRSSSPARASPGASLRLQCPDHEVSRRRAGHRGRGPRQQAQAGVAHRERPARQSAGRWHPRLFAPHRGNRPVSGARLGRAAWPRNPHRARLPQAIGLRSEQP